MGPETWLWLRALILAKASGSTPSAHMEAVHLLRYQAHMCGTDKHAGRAPHTCRIKYI